MSFAPPPEFTPTLHEWAMASIFPNPVKMWSDKTGESMFYFNLNIAAAGIAAYRKRGETFAVLRFMYWLRALPQQFLFAGLAAQTYLLGSAVHTMTTRDKFELLSGVPDEDDTLIEKLLKLAFMD